MATLQDQIDAIVSEKNAIDARIASLTSSGNAWLADGNDDICNQIVRSRKYACITEKNRKINLGNSRLAEANALKTQSSDLQRQLNSLYEQQQAVNEATVTLARQGQDVQSNLVLAEAKAEAIESTAQKTAQANAEEIAKNEESARKRKMLFTIIGVLIGLAILTLVILKIKKNRK